jgi:hypothetical protein
VPFV